MKFAFDDGASRLVHQIIIHYYIIIKLLLLSLRGLSVIVLKQRISIELKRISIYMYIYIYM